MYLSPEIQTFMLVPSQPEPKAHRLHGQSRLLLLFEYRLIAMYVNNNSGSRNKRRCNRSADFANFSAK